MDDIAPNKELNLVIAQKLQLQKNSTNFMRNYN
jgi:hypothetical protein